MVINLHQKVSIGLRHRKCQIILININYQANGNLKKMKNPEQLNMWHLLKTRESKALDFFSLLWFGLMTLTSTAG